MKDDLISSGFDVNENVSLSLIVMKLKLNKKRKKQLKILMKTRSIVAILSRN